MSRLNADDLEKVVGPIPKSGIGFSAVVIDDWGEAPFEQVRYYSTYGYAGRPVVVRHRLERFGGAFAGEDLEFCPRVKHRAEAWRKIYTRSV